MEQEELDLMRKEGKEWTARELIEGSGGVLDNFILREIVECSSSPKAADEYIKLLGWPNNVAKKVRNASRLKFKFPKQWELFKESSVRPVEIFSFCQIATPFLFKHGVEISDGIVFEKATRSFKHWPLLLRDFRCYAPRCSSLDGEYKKEKATTTKRIDGLTFRMDHNLINHDYTTILNCELGSMGALIFCKDNFLRIESKHFIALSCSSFFYEPWAPGETAFPVWRKVIQIQEKKPAAFYLDRIRINVRQDNIPPYTYPDIGELVFERIIPVSSKYEAVFTVVYKIHDMISERLAPLYCVRSKQYRSLVYSIHPIVYRNKNPNSPFILFNEAFSSNETFDSKAYSFAAENLKDLCEHFYSNDPVDERFSIHAVIGDVFFAQEPKTLIDLLLSAKSSSN
ncbi:MAG: hypothetical protein HY764_00295 [Candidatus Portnoybacteria bacterium]|nr:hypothetical protein [Candidatus Portnoybacteria bacterium]